MNKKKQLVSKSKIACRDNNESKKKKQKISTIYAMLERNP